MAMYLLSILRKDESAPIFVKALLYRFAFHNFSCIYVSSFLSQVLFIIVDKWFVNLFKRAQGRLVPPIGSPSVNKVYLLTYLSFKHTLIGWSP